MFTLTKKTYFYIKKSILILFTLSFILFLSFKLKNFKLFYVVFLKIITLIAWRHDFHLKTRLTLNWVGVHIFYPTQSNPTRRPARIVKGWVTVPTRPTSPSCRFIFQRGSERVLVLHVQTCKSTYCSYPPPLLQFSLFFFVFVVVGALFPSSFSLLICDLVSF